MYDFSKQSWKLTLPICVASPLLAGCDPPWFCELGEILSLILPRIPFFSCSWPCSVVVVAVGEVVSVVGLWLCPILSSAMAVDVVKDLFKRWRSVIVYDKQLDKPGIGKGRRSNGWGNALCHFEVLSLMLCLSWVCVCDFFRY